MTKFEFAAAVARVEDEGKQEELIELGFGDFGTLHAHKPTLTQILNLSDHLDGRSTIRETFSANKKFLIGLLVPEDVDLFEDLITRGVITRELLLGGDDSNEKGIIDSIAETVTDGRPSQPPTDSSPSRPNGGRRSTGRAPGKGSTRSTSPSDDSST